MMRIGIITFHNANNHGACLQAFGLQQYLKKIGHDVSIIDYDSKITKHYSLIVPIFRKNILKYLKQWRYNIKHYRRRKVRYDNFNRFFYQYYQLSKIHYRNEWQLKHNYPRYDMYITGSDQVWNEKLIGKLEDSFTLNFGDSKTKRISYAASLGVDNIDAKKEEKYRKKLSGIEKISVRERSAVSILKSILNRPIALVLDPVFLLDQATWKDAFKDQFYFKENYILVYSVVYNEELIKIANYLSDKTGYGIVAFENVTSYQNLIYNAEDDGPDCFVNLLKNAEYVITNSFHAIAFSLIMERKFYVIPHNTTNSRIASLLDLVGLSDRQVLSFQEFVQREELQPIDYKEVLRILKKEVQNSVQFLEESIESN